MGVESSRCISLPSNINDEDFRKEIICNWNTNNSSQKQFNIQQQHPQYVTSNVNTLIEAGEHIKKFFEKIPKFEIKILEIMCGNGCASNWVYFSMKSLNISKWIMTDLFDWNKKELTHPFEFEQLNSVDAVEKFGGDSNVLLMISPPPTTETDRCGFGDYYACYDFILQTKKQNKTKFIIFVGELGASDGSTGMYKYMIENPDLKLLVREMLLLRKDIFGGNCEKELFIFEILV
jgi:hypothetical protein